MQAAASMGYLFTMNRPAFRALVSAFGGPRRLFSSSVPRFDPHDCNGRFKTILTETRGRVEVVYLNRPRALNALSNELMSELGARLREVDDNHSIAAVVLTGSGSKAFAAGADIKQMKDTNYADNYRDNFLGHWTAVSDIRKPIIAAVNGYALGGGCELAMMCDVIYASPQAVFGQPEIKLGTIPGAGGSQRLIKAVGKSKAMEMVLTGDNMNAEEACSRGLVSKVTENVVDDAVHTAEKMARMSLPVLMMCKEAVNAANEMTLREGLRFERRLFQSTFALEDQKEGMAAFAEKRKADFKHR